MPAGKKHWITELQELKDLLGIGMDVEHVAMLRWPERGSVTGMVQETGCALTELYAWENNGWRPWGSFPQNGHRLDKLKPEWVAVVMGWPLSVEQSW